MLQILPRESSVTRVSEVRNADRRLTGRESAAASFQAMDSQAIDTPVISPLDQGTASSWKYRGKLSRQDWGSPFVRSAVRSKPARTATPSRGFHSSGASSGRPGGSPKQLNLFDTEDGLRTARVMTPQPLPSAQLPSSPRLSSEQRPFRPTPIAVSAAAPAVAAQAKICSDPFDLQEVSVGRGFLCTAVVLVSLLALWVAV